MELNPNQYEKVVPLLVDPIKEQQTLIEDLSNRLKVLKTYLQDGFKILDVQIINGGVF